MSEDINRIIEVRTYDNKTDFCVHPTALGLVLNILFDEGWEDLRVGRTPHRSVRIWVPNESAGDLRGSTCQSLAGAGFEVDLPL